MLQSLSLCHWCRKRRIIYYSEFVFELFGHSQVEGQLSELYENVGSDTERYWKQSRYLDADYIYWFLSCLHILQHRGQKSAWNLVELPDNPLML